RGLGDLYQRQATHGAFQVRRLADDALNGVTGPVESHEHFTRF
ncbi:GNAT family N-acetyltransferase, partial [Escherichia coli]|nr:GNAT family N-acetyltransferase [Escherichia coli]